MGFTDKEIEKNLKEILSLGWDDEEGARIEKLLRYFQTWKRWIPSSIENDIRFVIDLAIKEKRKINELTKNLELKP